MEFRVWLTLPSEKDGRKFMGEIVQDYPVSPQGSQNELPIYAAGSLATLVSFRVTTNAETQDEYNAKFDENSPDYDRENPPTLPEDSEDATEVYAYLEGKLKELGIQWMSIVVNERQGQASCGLPEATLNRFKLIKTQG
jgi:hypothetical protein